MEMGRFFTEVSDPKIYEIIAHFTRETVTNIQRVCERYGTEEEDVREYDVYRVRMPGGDKILKLTEEREAFNYETYLAGGEYAVPGFYGKWTDGEDVWILIEDASGEDLRDMTEELAEQAAECLARIQNAFWQEEGEFEEKKTDDRFEVYWKRILRRAVSVAEHPVLRKAYQKFLDRQLECPRTLSNGDFLQFNVVHSGDKVTVLDWGFGGIMPYSLDIARFIAHATEERSTFPFYMNDGQKRSFVEGIYERLERKPEHGQYLMDVKLAVLNEYIEFVEAEEDEDGWYYDHAVKLAQIIIGEE